MLFVLNTGRAGSRSIANVLSQHPELACTHEPLPRLVEETAEYRYGRLSADKLAETLAETRPASIDGRRYAESANRLSLAVPVLASTFPDAQFIWLVRDGREVVSSGMQRGWFDPAVVKDTQWERHRLRGDELGEMSPEEWADWSPFRRVCWLWRRTNEIIGQDLAAIEPERSMHVRLEDLADRLPDVAEFLEIPHIDWVVPRQNARAALPDTGPLTVNQIQRRLGSVDWTDQQAAIFADECGALMSRWYPGWRENEPSSDVEALRSGGADPAIDRLDSLQVDLADLRVFRSELSLLTAHSLRADRRAALASGENEKLNTRLVRQRDVHARQLAERDTAAASLTADLLESQRATLAATERVAALQFAVDRVEELEGQLERAKSAAATAKKKMTKAQNRVALVEASESFRLGHGIVRTVRLPSRAARTLRSRARRVGSRIRRALGLSSPSVEQASASAPTAKPSPTPVAVSPDPEVGFGDLDRLDPRDIALGALTRFRMTAPAGEDAAEQVGAALDTLGNAGVGEILVPSSTPSAALAMTLDVLSARGCGVEVASRSGSLVLDIELDGVGSSPRPEDVLLRAAAESEELEAARRAVKKLEKTAAQEARTHSLRLEKAHDSTQYRVGAAVVDAVNNPAKAVKLPGEIWRLHRRRSTTEPPTTPTGSEIVPELDLRVVSILDEFTHDCFAPEFDLVPLDRRNWRSQLEGAGLVFVESAWRGNGGKWNYTLNKFEKNGDDVRGLLDAAREAGIPSVFWNKEDPVSFDVFLPAAAAFDAVLTTDRNMVDDYKRALGHDRVDALAFAAQPRLHNPIGRGRDVAGRVCFAGSWRGDKYAQRGSDFDILLGPPLERGALDIYDRYAGGPDADKLGFPDPFASAVVGSLPYSEMGTAYRRYAAFLNVNSVQDSPTMFSRRVFELLACGTPVISTPARGIDEMLGDTVLVTDSREKTADYVDWVLNEPEERDRHAHRGYRLVHREHNYQTRVDALLDHVGAAPRRRRRRVSVICVSNRPEMLGHAIESYLRQTYDDKEFIFVANSSSFDEAMLGSVQQRVPGAKVSRVDESATLGECLNEALSTADGEFFAKFDDDDHYGTEYLADLMMTFPYTGAAVAGKQTYYAYLESQDRTVLRFPGKEFRSAPRVVGGTIVADRSQVGDIAFEAVPRGTDSQFLNAVRARGLTIFSADRFNFCQVRHADVTTHTWAIDDAEFLKACVDTGNGFREDAVFI